VDPDLTRSEYSAGAIHVASGKSLLFIPRLPEAYAVWMGKYVADFRGHCAPFALPVSPFGDCRIQPPSHFQALYAVDEVYFVDELAAKLHALGDATRLLIMAGVNSDSKLSSPPVAFEGLDTFAVDKVFFLRG
jgi:Xaa-Pro dipeptidase